MISMGTIWDRTMEVIRGRLAILATITLMLIFAPSVVQAVIDAAAGVSAIGKLLGVIVAIFVIAAAVVASLAITAVATDPAVDRQAALAIGGARIGPMLGVSVVLVIVAIVSALPGIVLLALSGIDWERAQAGLSQDAVNVGMLALSVLYLLLLSIVWLWAGARLVPLAGVIVNERLGLGAIRRAFALSRGSAMKLIGVLILYSIVFLVVMLAVGAVVGLITGVIVGAEHASTITLIVAIVTAAVTSVFTVLQTVFSGQFYVAVRALADPSRTFE